MVKIEESLGSQLLPKFKMVLVKSRYQRMWLRFTNTGSFADRPRSGRPIKSSERNHRRLCMEANKVTFLSAQEHGESSMSSQVGFEEVKVSQRCTNHTLLLCKTMSQVFLDIVVLGQQKSVSSFRLADTAARPQYHGKYMS